MSSHSTDLNRLFDLMGAICDDDASPSDFVELDSIVQADGGARSWYRGYCQLHGTLRVELRADRATQAVCSQIGIRPTVAESNRNSAVAVDAPALSAPALPSDIWHSTFSYFSSGWPVAYLVATVIFGIGLAIGAFTYVSQPTADVANTPSALDIPLVRSEAEPVGHITGMVDCKWVSGHPSPASGGHHEVVGAGGEGSLQLRSPVRLHNRFALASGLLEITYDTGAKVILQGPATYQAESKNGGYLSLGKLTGKVEVEKAKGFVVRTPTATITDLGTEFGVEVSKEGNTTSRVYRGSVRLQVNSDDETAEGSARVLHENESASIVNSADGRRGGPRITAVGSAAEVVDFVREIRRCGAAPHLTHLWTFDSTGDDQIGGNDYRLTFSGSAACDTRDAQIGSGSLSGLTTAQSYAVVKKYFAPDARFTLSAWVKTRSGGISHSIFAWGQRNGNGLSRQFRLGEHSPSLPGTGRVIYGQVGEGQVWKSVSSGTFEVNDGAWHHVAVARDQHRATLYVDGVTEPGWTSYLMGGDPKTGEVTIGGMALNPYQFRGQIDDLGYWATALSTGQVRAIYHLGNHPAMRYGQKDIASLFALYARGAGQVVCAGRTWTVCSSLTEREIGSLVNGGDGTYTLYLDTNAGLTTSSGQTNSVFASPRQTRDVGGEILAQHLGNADPATEQFFQGGTGSVGPGTDTIGGKTPVWNIDTSQVHYYVYRPSMAQIASVQSLGWEAEVTVRPASYPLSINEQGGHGISFCFATDPGDATGTRVYALRVGADGSGNPLLGWMNNQHTYAITPITVVGVSGAGFHTYKLVCEKPETDTAKVYVDGIYQTTLHAITGSLVEPHYNSLSFGSDSSEGKSNTGQWANVTFRTLSRH